MSDDIDLDALTRLEAAAASAPWGECGESGEWWVSPMNRDGEYLPDVIMNSGPDDIHQANLDLLIALRNAAPALLSTARNYERLLAAVRNAMGSSNPLAALAELHDFAERELSHE